MDFHSPAPSSSPDLDRIGAVAIIGVGLIGGSVGLALKRRAGSAISRIIGIGRDSGRLAEAQALGAADETTTDWAEGLKDADIAVICTPTDRIAADAERASRFGPPHLLITDAGSAKARIVSGIEAGPASAMFVGAHPIAGSERQGAAEARADLFENRCCVLTPTPKTSPDRLERARRFWRATGCRLIEMAPDDHDRALAMTSHLPHAVAGALAAAVPEQFHELGAGAFRDGTRVAEAGADLWTAIFLENRLPVLQALDAFQSALSAFRGALEQGDADALRDWWRFAADRRRRFAGRHFQPPSSSTSSSSSSSFSASPSLPRPHSSSPLSEPETTIP